MAQARTTRRIVVSLALSFVCPLPGIAAQRFSFSGLNWGESLDESKAKLTEAGHTLGELFTYPGRTGSFSLSFSGTIGGAKFRGSARFFESKLTSVRLDFPLDPRSRHVQINAIEELVERRYGKGRRGKITDGRDRTKAIWGQEPNETLSLTVTDRAGTSGSESGVLLDYSSSKVHEIARRVQAEYEEEQRKQRAKEEAKKAAASSRL
ncbi:hypothetical protein [Hydrogenophaga sp. PML113]|uniref:hypothetical protein n=1 Tax=Hydrogenophaga sp. PML113 TaxID=1899350 RepID=UPI001586CFBC|nr:hypothetical protein [Hydrogenophaga sp. PML113]